MNNAKKSMTILYLVLIHLALVVVLLESDFIDKLRLKIGGSSVEITPHFRDMVSYHKRIDGNVPNGAVIFIGDSLTQGLCVSAIAPVAVNYGIGNDTTVGVLKRLHDYESINRAKAVVLAIGINDMEFRSNDEILLNIKAIRSYIPSTVPVVISGVLPIDVAESLSWEVGRIVDLNTDLKNLAESIESTIFLDSGALMQDGEGRLKRALHIGDGVHLNAAGNEIWINSLKKALTERL